MAEEVSMSKKGAIGSIRIADEVVGIIAGLAATEIDGVAGMSGGIAGGIAEMLGKKSFTKGVKVEVGEKETAVDLYMIVKYGARCSHRCAGKRQEGNREHDGADRRRSQCPCAGRELR